MTEFKKGGGDDFYDYSLYYPFNGLLSSDSTNSSIPPPIINPPEPGKPPRLELKLSYGSTTENVIGETIKLKLSMVFYYTGYPVAPGAVTSMTFKFPPGFNSVFSLTMTGYRAGEISVHGRTYEQTFVTKGCNYEALKRGSAGQWDGAIELTRTRAKTSLVEEVSVSAYGVNCTPLVATASVSF